MRLVRHFYHHYHFSQNTCDKVKLFNATICILVVRMQSLALLCVDLMSTKCLLTVDCVRDVVDSRDWRVY